MVCKYFYDSVFVGGVEDEEDDTRDGLNSFAKNHLLIPLLFEPEVGELVPFSEFVISHDPALGKLVSNSLGLVGGQNVREKGEGHDDADQQKFFEE